MSVENGEWIMRGLAWDDPYRIRTWRELIARSREVSYGKFFGKKGGIYQPRMAAVLCQRPPPTQNRPRTPRGADTKALDLRRRKADLANGRETVREAKPI